ncbi:histidine phosphatase family protein [Candidatus Nomurabacteria bacterium]|nr:histidine phosphatase family protein [Candidatus Nomurabacteria bacterium]
MSQKLIYFVRHGESELNARGIRQGREGALSEKGRMQVHETAERFPKKKGKPEIIIASPYERTKETAEIIANELKMKVYYSELLVERRNPSEIVGHAGKEKTVQEIVDKIDKSFHDDSLRYSDEENFTDLKHRAKELLAYIKTLPENRIIMVTHGIFLKMVISYIVRGESLNASEYNKLSFFNAMDNAGITIVKYIPHWFKKDEWKLVAWNNELNEMLK